MVWNISIALPFIQNADARIISSIREVHIMEDFMLIVLFSRHYGLELEMWLPSNPKKGPYSVLRSTAWWEDLVRYFKTGLGNMSPSSSTMFLPRSSKFFKHPAVHAAQGCGHIFSFYCQEPKLRPYQTL